jgi:hypothetical protein
MIESIRSFIERNNAIIGKSFSYSANPCVWICLCDVTKNTATRCGGVSNYSTCLSKLETDGCHFSASDCGIETVTITRTSVGNDAIIRERIGICTVDICITEYSRI